MKRRSPIGSDENRCDLLHQGPGPVRGTPEPVRHGGNGKRALLPSDADLGSCRHREVDLDGPLLAVEHDVLLLVSLGGLRHRAHLDSAVPAPGEPKQKDCRVVRRLQSATLSGIPLNEGAQVRAHPEMSPTNQRDRSIMWDPRSPRTPQPRAVEAPSARLPTAVGSPGSGSSNGSSDRSRLSGSALAHTGTRASTDR